jgi:hypothetical protein
MVDRMRTPYPILLLALACAAPSVDIAPLASDFAFVEIRLLG